MAQQVVTAAERLCSHENPVIAYRARRLLEREGTRSRPMRRLREAIGTSEMARALLTPQRGKVLHPYAKWQGPHWTLYSLAEIAHPGGEVTLPLRDRVLDWLSAPAFQKPPRTAIYPDQPERPRGCASMEGNALWSQVLLGIVDERRTPLLVERLLAFQWPDGGWNCDKRKGARTSSVQETLIPLRALSLWAKETGDARAKKAAARAAKFLLERRLLWRRGTGELIEPDWGGPVDQIQYPFRFYDVLSALLVMGELGLLHDRRCVDALDLLESKRLADGSFPPEWTNATTTRQLKSDGTFAQWGPRGKKQGNPFVTIDALFVLREAGRLSSRER